MLLLGRSNWWFPGWLDRILPRLSVDPDTVHSGVVADDRVEQPEVEAMPA